MDELTNFREVVKGYSALTPAQLNSLIINKNLIEICHDQKI